ncbi:sigma-70 family RNA polymerase sigma factor [Alteromonadaceae bacterium M269]|nr:sigma-70 family RNA polymerase sigma factor [Alteromonadaceae bacterium M269]
MNRDFQETLDKYGALLSRVASTYEANHHLQQELLQEITLAVWQALTRFKGESSEKTYIMRVAHNRAVNHVAYHAKQPKSDTYCEVSEPADNGKASAESTLQKEKQIDSLLVAVRKLPIQTRQIVTLSMEGLSYQEISEVNGVKANNVGVILNRARKTLMEQIQHVE